MTEKAKKIGNEKWKDIVGYEGLYQVSNYGRIKSLSNKIKYSSGIIHFYPEKILKQQKIQGYCYAGLTKNKKQKKFRVHRLVAEAFIENPYNYEQVNHLDFDKTNNTIENLEWCDAYRQNQHSALKPNRKWGLSNIRRYGKLNHKSKKVLQINMNGDIVSVFDSGCLAQKETLIHQSRISACCLGIRKTAGGFKWRFADALLEELAKEEE
jgi:hypothetical protein